MVGVVAKLFLLIAVSGHAPPSDGHGAGQVRKFVQSFYNWYLPRASKPKVDSVTLAVTAKASLFAPELRRALLEDRKAQAKVSNMIVGLDGDPFLNSQDFSDRYSVGDAKSKGRTWLVSVHGILSGKRSKEPAVVAVVEKTKSGWRFTNFLFPEGGDVLSLLRQLKKERETGGRGRRRSVG